MLRFRSLSSLPPGHPEASPSAVLNRILVVDPDEGHRRELQLLLSQEGCRVAAVNAAEPALRELDGNDYDILFCDDECLSSELVERGRAGTVLVIAMVGNGSRAHALATADSADDCLFKPVDAGKVAVALRRVARIEEAGSEQSTRRETRREPHRRSDGLAGMVGVSAAMQAVFRTIEKVAQHKANVLITGESGTGKELVARAMHDLGPRKRRPFIAINCGAIPGTLLESELFGHRRGAFTDAIRDKVGLFEEADGGTLFLDEIGELPVNLQVKLLRAIQEEEIRRIGDNSPISVDVRIISATLLDLADAIQVGLFREDLFYRINVLPIALPPLRDRREDIPPLVDHFLRRYWRKHSGAGMKVEAVADDAMKLLVRYSWPGNIRELENTIERAMVLCDGSLIKAALLEDKLRKRSDPIQAALASDELSIKKTTRVVEEELIRRALATTGGNRTNAAKLLEISHRALLYKIKEYEL